MSPKKRHSPRHPFRFQIQLDPSQPPEVITAWAKVIKAKVPVKLTVTVQDVQRSIMLRGAGNTQTCTMAVCAKRQKVAFPHAVEGYIDWQYRMCYVVTRVSKETGLPLECVAYEHNDETARLNDSPSGQQKLLEMLKESGPRTIHLRPPKKKKPRLQGRPKGELTGERSPRPTVLSGEATKRPIGARLRYAVAKAGGVVP